MSVSKYMYDPEHCDGIPCVGDCDLCSEWKKWDDIEDDGFITPDWAMEQKTEDTAVPIRECRYPRCEECKDYVSRDGRWYCTVPMVISKQTWLLTTELILGFERRLCAVEELVEDDVLSAKNPSQVRENERISEATALLSDGVD